MSSYKFILHQELLEIKCRHPSHFWNVERWFKNSTGNQDISYLVPIFYFLILWLPRNHLNSLSHNVFISKIKTVIAVSTKEEKSKIYMYRHTVIYDRWLMKSSIQLCFTHSNVRLLKESLDYYIRPTQNLITKNFL